MGFLRRGESVRRHEDRRRGGGGEDPYRRPYRVVMFNHRDRRMVIVDYRTAYTMSSKGLGISSSRGAGAAAESLIPGLTVVSPDAVCPEVLQSAKRSVEAGIMDSRARRVPGSNKEVWKTFT